MRQIHDLEQGSQEWNEFRAIHYGASDASAMLGLSPYKTRSELLREKKIGITPEVDSFTQKIFERGHEIEAIAKKFAEKYIGDDLFPAVYSFGKLSASCDGITFDEETAWECKSSNQADYEVVKNGGLPEKHWPQCEQVMLVTGAKRLLFTISDGTEENTAHTWVYPDKELQGKIIAGWEQFEKDLEEFEVEPVTVTAKADTVMALPALSIQVGGAISIQSNLDRFGERLKSFIDESNKNPETDLDFANLEQACKVLKEAEDTLKQAEKSALSQTASVDEMRRTVAFLAELARSNRLTFEKIVKSEKENRKTSIIVDASNKYAQHCKSLQANLQIIFNPKSVNFGESAKNKKSLLAIQDAANTMLANAKIEADALCAELREKHIWYLGFAANYEFLFSDIQSLIYKHADDFNSAVINRIKQHVEQQGRLNQESALQAKAIEQPLVSSDSTIDDANQEIAEAMIENNVASVIYEADLLCDEQATLIKALFDCGLKNTKIFSEAIALINKQSPDKLDGYRIQVKFCTDVIDITRMLNDIPTDVKPIIRPLLTERQAKIKNEDQRKS